MMLEQTLVQTLLLLGATVFVVLVFQRLRVPSSLAYLSVGIMLGSHTAGPVVQAQYIDVIAEFGIVFLLFTIGLSFTLSQIYAMRHTILGLGTAQVMLTTAVVGLVAYGLGLPPAAAFVVGAVFAQSSTTIISRQLDEQGESDTRHGRLGTAMSVFQDVTAVPFVIIIPVLGIAAASDIAGSLGVALLKAVAALVVVLVSGRYLLRPLFHLVAERRSAELFTLTVLFVSLVAAWTTNALGLSMAFGAFLAGMVLGETEFRHQVESTIRPFRDVLLGLFFVSIGMLFQPALLPDLWLEALSGAAALLVIKLGIVFAIVRLSGVDSPTAFRTGLILAVGGEFGFALVAIGFGHGAIDDRLAQILLTSVMFSMVLAPFLIRYNLRLSRWLLRRRTGQKRDEPPAIAVAIPEGRFVLLCGFGRTGQIVARFLEDQNIAYLAIDVDPAIVREARLAGQPVHYADSTDPAVLESMNAGRAMLAVICHNDRTAAMKTLRRLRELHPTLPTLARARDEGAVEDLRKAGADEVIPETLEAGMTLASHALLSLDVTHQTVMHYVSQQRAARYPMLRELFRGTVEDIHGNAADVERLHSVRIDSGSPCIGSALGDLQLGEVMVSTLVRSEERKRYPAPEEVLEAGDVLVLLGTANSWGLLCGS